MPRRRWKAGSRPTLVNPWRQAWTDNFLGSFSWVFVPREKRDEDAKFREENRLTTGYDAYKPEPGDAVYLTFPLKDGTYTVMDLTRFTEEELRQIWYIFQLAFESALPLVRERDEYAKQAEEQGPDFYDRAYRILPRLSHRAGEKYEHGPELRAGHQELLEAVRGGSFRERIFGLSQLLANAAKEDTGVEDDQSEPGEREGVHQMGEDQE